MGKGKIGLKLADGEFYPVLEEGGAARKRLVVTTVQDGQRSVQIDLYRGEGERVEDASYIGSLVVEGIPAMAKGEPDIRMDVGLGDDETLSAYAEEASTGANQSLKVSLKALSDEEKYEIPDFEFSSPAEKIKTPASFDDEDFADTDQLPSSEEAELLAPDAEAEKPAERGARKPLLIALFALAVLAAALGLGYLIYRLALGPKPGPVEEGRPIAAQPAPTPAPPAPAPAPAAAKPAAPAPAVAAPAVPAPAAAKPAAPAAPKPAAAKPAPAAKTPGVNYKIKWGDTLWDLSYAYYRNPWYYPRIAKANKIKNPDRIIAGSKIWIPKL